MKRICLSTALAALLMLAAMIPNAAWASDITVSAAMSLKEAFTELGKRYEAQHPSVKVRFNFGASGDLVRQIAGGAPVDVFASASSKDMDDVSAYIDASTRQVIASNSIVAVVPASRSIKASDFTRLAAPDIIRIATGNPVTTPIGRYAAEVYAYYGITEKLRDKLVPVETVRQGLDYVIRGEVDAAVIYKTDALARATEVRVVAEAPGNSHKPVAYPIALIKGAQGEGMGFIAYAMSPEGQGVLVKYGFSQAGK